MDLQALYDLKERLEHAAIAGTGLLQEDFRLKRAVETLAPLGRRHSRVRKDRLCRKIAIVCPGGGPGEAAAGRAGPGGRGGLYPGHGERARGI